MKATQLLKHDHDTVKELFKEYEEAGDRAYSQKTDLFEEIERELTLHATIEEELFYPELQKVRSSEARDLVAEANEEHAVVKRLLAELAELDADDEQFDAKMKVMMENVKHHIKEEESELFDQAEKHLSAERLEDLGAKLESRKDALQTANVRS
jgi:hemerythrin-like domain-containing protein